MDATQWSRTACTIGRGVFGGISGARWSVRVHERPLFHKELTLLHLYLSFYVIKLHAEQRNKLHHGRRGRPRQSQSRQVRRLSCSRSVDRLCIFFYPLLNSPMSASAQNL